VNIGRDLFNVDLADESLSHMFFAWIP